MAESPNEVTSDKCAGKDDELHTETREYPQGCNMYSDDHCTCVLGEKLMTMKMRGNQR